MFSANRHGHFSYSGGDFFPTGISVIRLFGSVSECMGAVCLQSLYFLPKKAVRVRGLR